MVEVFLWNQRMQEFKLHKAPIMQNPQIKDAYEQCSYMEYFLECNY